jgi:hypothetical protein
VRGEAHQLLRRRIAERPQDDHVEDREDRRVGANPERERQQRHDGEDRAAPQGAESVAHVAPDLVEPGAVTRRTDALLRLLDPA